MDDRMQDAVLKAGRAVDEVEAVRAKLKIEHSTVLALTKQLDTVTARSQRLARAYQRSRLVATAGNVGSARIAADLDVDVIEEPAQRGMCSRAAAIRGVVASECGVSRLELPHLFWGRRGCRALAPVVLHHLVVAPLHSSPY